MMRYGWTIGVATWRIVAPGAKEVKSFLDPIIGKVWSVPFVVSDEEVAEHVFAGGVRVCR